MARAAVADAIDTALRGFWDETQAVIYDTNEVGNTPAGDVPFIVVQYPVVDTTRPTISTRVYRETGAFRVVIHIPTGLGTSQARQWADQIADFFRDKDFDGVECGVPSSPLTHDDNDQGRYFRVSVVVPYAFNFNG